MAIACVLLMKARQRHLIHISTQYLPRRNYPFLLYPSQTLYNLFSDIDISVYGVYKQPLQLSPRKTCGPDGIPARAPENLAPSIAPWVSFIFQRCYDTGTAPSDWTKALVTGIHKTNSESNAANYRPVSLTSLCCKVMERDIILSHMSQSAWP